MSKKILIVGCGHSGSAKTAMVDGLMRKMCEDTEPIFYQSEMGGRGFEEAVRIVNEKKQKADVDRLINSFSDEELKKYEDAKFVSPLDLKTGQEERREKRKKSRVKFKNKKL